MKILRFEVEGFRSLRQIDWRPGSLNVVIGPNGSGKSNLLRTLELLSVAANGGLGDYVKQEGGIEPLMWDGRAACIRVRCKLSPAEDGATLTEKATPTTSVWGVWGCRVRTGSTLRCLVGFSRSRRAATGPFKLLERDPRHAVIFDSEQRELVAHQGIRAGGGNVAFSLRRTLHGQPSHCRRTSSISRDGGSTRASIQTGMHRSGRLSWREWRRASTQMARI